MSHGGRHGDGRLGAVHGCPALLRRGRPRFAFVDRRPRCRGHNRRLELGRFSFRRSPVPRKWSLEASLSWLSFPLLSPRKRNFLSPRAEIPAFRSSVTEISGKVAGIHRIFSRPLAFFPKCVAFFVPGVELPLYPPSFFQSHLSAPSQLGFLPLQLFPFKSLLFSLQTQYLGSFAF